MTTVKSITVEFSKGGFQEWTEATGDTYPQAFVDEWETNYNRIITERLEVAFPGAEIEVNEGYDQLMYTKIDIDFEADEDNWSAEENLRSEVRHLLDLGNDALDQVWTTPSVEAISEAIDDATDERPIMKLEFQGANYVFSKHDGAIWWMDLDVDDPLNPDDDWIVGTLEDAAIAFRDEFDPDFELITQAEAAEIAGVTLAAVNNAIRDGRLNSYRKGDAPAHKPGANLVSKSDVVELWDKKD